MLHQVQLLMDDADAERLRRARVTDVDLFAKILDRTAVALVDTGQDLHQRRLARAVFTDQRHDLPLFIQNDQYQDANLFAVSLELE